MIMNFMPFLCSFNALFMQLVFMHYCTVIVSYNFMQILCRFCAEHLYFIVVYTHLPCIQFMQFSI
jgi:hypothetical protein